jgi:hypothetical protein
MRWRRAAPIPCRPRAKRKYPTRSACRCRCRFGRHLADVAQPRDALARGDELLPAPERDLDRCQRAAHHDRRGDHDAARCMVRDHEIGADAQHPRLQHVTQHLRTRPQIGLHVGGADIFAQIAFIDLGPAHAEPLGHAERANDLGIALRRVREHLPLRAGVHRGPGGAARQAFVQKRHRHDRNRAEQRDKADQRMKQE